MKKGIRVLAAFLLLMSVALSACSPAAPAETTPALQETTPAPDTTPAPVTDPVTTEPEIEYNYLTGPVAYGGVLARPAVFVINNIKIAAKYQSGVSKADVVFEVEAEGGITRLLAVFADPSNVPKIGSVRSAREALVRIAQGLDGFFFHAGGSPFAYDAISAAKVDSIDGTKVSDPYYRDSSVAAAAAYEHSLFTTGATIARKLAALEKSGKRMTLKDGYRAPFSFYEEDTVPAGQGASKVTTKYSSSFAPYFVYSASSGLYTRYQYGAVHTDKDSGDTLEFKNLIVLSVPSRLRSGDDKGRRIYSDIGSGKGVYLTNGVYTEITWSKASAAAPLKIFNAAGDALKINPGKTFISYVNGTSAWKIDN